MKRSTEEDGERQNCPTLNFPKSHKISAEPFNCPKYLQHPCRIDLKFSELFFDLFERKNKGLNIFELKKKFRTLFFINFVGKVIILCDITLLLNSYSNYKTLDTLCHLWSLWA